MKAMWKDNRPCDALEVIKEQGRSNRLFKGANGGSVKAHE